MPRARSSPAPQPLPAPESTGERLGLADLAVLLLALLLPLLGAGLPLDELPTPGAAAGRWTLWLLATVAVFAGRPRRAPVGRAACWALIAVGAVATLVPRPGPVVSPTIVAGVPALAGQWPADLEAGLGELARLGLLGLLAAAGRRARRSCVLAGLAGGAGLVVLRGLREYLPQWRDGGADWRVFAGFTNPNLAANWLIVVLSALAAVAVLATAEAPPARWLARQGVDRASLKLRVAAVLLVAAALLVLLLTRSRGGLLGLLVGGLAAVLGLLRAGRPRLARQLLGGGAVLALLVVLSPLGSRLTAGARLAHSGSFRVLTWRGTLDLAAAQPWLGVGLGGWPASYPLYARAAFTQHAHSAYLQVLAESGVGGLAAFLALGGACLLAGWRAAADPGRRALGLAVLAATGGFLTHATLDCGWSVTAVPATLLLLVGTSAAPVTSPGPSRRGWSVVGSLLVGALLALGWATEARRAAAQENLAAGAALSAREELRAATRLTPYSALAWEDLAGAEEACGDPAAARRAYARAQHRRPYSARLRYREAALLAREGDLPTALAAAAQSVALSPLHLQGYLQLGRLLEQAGRTAEARRVFERLDQVAQLPALSQAGPLQGYTFEPTHGYGLLRLAELRLAAGDPPGAREAFERALPDLEAYLTTFEREAALMGALPAEDRARLLTLRGLHEDERATVKELTRHAREQILRLPAR